jgi:hypothetical protein
MPMRSLWFALLLAALPLRSEIVDRVLAVVGERVITWSEVCAEAEYQAFRDALDPPTCAASGAAGPISPALQTALSSLTDQALLEQAMARSPFSPPPPGEPQDGLRQLQQRFADPGAYHAALARYHLTEEEVPERLARQQTLLAFVDSLLRPQISIDPAMVERYYEDKFVPEMRRQSSAEPPLLDDVREQIREILTQQEINRLLEVRLEEMRRSTTIKLWPE